MSRDFDFRDSDEDESFGIDVVDGGRENNRRIYEEEEVDVDVDVVRG